MQMVYLSAAKKTVCIDHHISNASFADANYIVPDASSASELVFNTMEEDKISKRNCGMSVHGNCSMTDR